MHEHIRIAMKGYLANDVMKGDEVLTDYTFSNLRYKVPSEHPYNVQNQPNSKTQLHHTLLTSTAFRTKELQRSSCSNRTGKSTICLEHILPIESVVQQSAFDDYGATDKNKISSPNCMMSNKSNEIGIDIKCETSPKILQATIIKNNNLIKTTAMSKVEPPEKQSSGNYKILSNKSELLVDLFSGKHLHIKPLDVIVNIVTVSKYSQSKSKQNTPHQQLRKDKERKFKYDNVSQQLNKEKERILTFRKYPRDAKMSALLLAASGYVYNGSGKDETVQCFFCRKNKGRLEWKDNIEQTHRKTCEMKTNKTNTNEPIHFKSINQSFNEMFKTLRKPTNSLNSYRATAIKSNQVQFADREISNRTRDAGLLTNSARFSQEHLIPESSQNTPSVIDTNVTGYENISTATVAAQLQISTSPLPTIGSIVSATVESYQMEEMNSSPAEMSGRFTQETIRSEALTSPFTLATNLLADPNQQVETSNTALVDTSSTSAGTATPSVEISPVFVTSSNSSTTTVTTTTSATRPNNGSSPTYEELGIITERPKRPEYALKLKRAETYASWPRDHHITTEELVNAGFYYAGYGDCTRCFYCGGGLRNWEDEDNVWVEHARWFPRCAYIRQQMGQVFVDTVQKMNTEFDKISMELVKQRLGVSSTTFHLDSLNLPLKRDPAVQSVIAIGYLEKDVLEMTQQIQQEGNTISSDLILEKLQNENKRPNHSHSIVNFSSIDTSEANETIRQLKEKNGQLRQQTNCKICMESEVAVVFLPCGHLVSCSECASAMRNCPLCRVPVKGIVRAFMG